jgi:hypothetical protein
MVNKILIFFIIIFLLFIIHSKFFYRNIKESFNNKNFNYKECVISNLDKYWENNFNSDIAFVTASTKEIYVYSKYSNQNLKYYCNKHKYKLYIFKEHLCKQVHPCWYKIILLNYLLKKHKYIVWVDSDAIITNPTIKIEKFIDNYHELFVCKDISNWRTPFNSGVMILKNNKNVKYFLSKVWKYDEIHGYTPNGDQDILNKMIFKENYPIKIKIYPMNYFNSHPRRYKKGDFILHLMVRTTNKRIQIMKEFNNYLNITKTNDKMKCINNNSCLHST